MREYVDMDVLASWVLMLRADVDGAICLSNDGEEARFYERCVSKAARVVPVPEAAFRLLARVERDGIRGVVATSRGVQPRPVAPNIFQPSVGDVASLLLGAQSSAAVIKELCGGAWLTACEKEVGPVCHRAAWVARRLQTLRSLCQAAGVAVALGVDSSEIFDWTSFDLSWDHLERTLTPNGIPGETLHELASLGPGPDIHSDLLACDGMDAVAIVAAATRMYRPRGIASSTGAQTPLLIGMLRAAFDLREFEKDDVFWRMRKWERLNGRYPLLEQWRMLAPLGVIWDQRYWESDLATMLEMLEPKEQLVAFEIDLDNFGVVNKKLGHSLGDEAIRTYYRVVKAVLGEVGEVYCRGGDEVLVLAPGLGQSTARELGEETRARVHKVFRDWASKHKLDPAPTASIGIALATAGEPPSEIVKSVDQAQCQAKQEGKNRVVVL